MAYKQYFQKIQRQGSGRPSQLEGNIDKNPFYKTTDIFNNAFKKKVRLQASTNGCNMTDCQSIWINFGEVRRRKIVDVVREGRTDQHMIYRLECGHEWEGKTGHPFNGSHDGPCSQCGAQQSYLGLEHEWQHIIFKTDIPAKQAFVRQYADTLLQQVGHNLDKEELEAFLHLFVNAFDDIRCNSLWERVYPGSANDIWERWRRLASEGDLVNTNFLGFVLGVGMGIPTDPNGEFEHLRPIIEWGTKKVRYRTFSKLLIDVRVVLDRCMSSLLAKMQEPPTPPPNSPQSSPQQQTGDQNGSDQEDSDQAKPDGSQQAPGRQEVRSGEDQEDALQATENQAVDQAQEGSQTEGGFGSGEPTAVSASAIAPAPPAKADALSKLIAGAKPLDEKEEHPAVDDMLLTQAGQAAVAMAMKVDIQDLDQLDVLFPDELDRDMDAAIQVLQDAAQQKTSASTLTSDAKAWVEIIDVTPDGLVSTSKVELNEGERFDVQRMRAAFFRMMGRQKAKRSVTGPFIDVPALVQYRLDHTDPCVYEEEEAQRGFTYSILCDMSGSMSGIYPQVCRATEMLKKSLDFPFVTGKLWGFRGGDRGSSVWIYRYDKRCEGYTGVARVANRFGRPGSSSVPVECGGITPMHTAVHIVMKDLRNQAEGLAKRLYILTDGSPCAGRVGGGSISPNVLRQFVAKEIRGGRKRGIQVYALVIGDMIQSDECRQMFGPDRFWKRSPSGGEVGTALSSLVRDNFTRYLLNRT